MKHNQAEKCSPCDAWMRRQIAAQQSTWLIDLRISYVSWLTVWGLNIELGGCVVGSNQHKASVYFTSYVLQNMVHITPTLKSVYIFYSFDSRIPVKHGIS